MTTQQEEGSFQSSAYGLWRRAYGTPHAISSSLRQDDISCSSQFVPPYSKSTDSNNTNFWTLLQFIHLTFYEIQETLNIVRLVQYKFLNSSPFYSYITAVSQNNPTCTAYDLRSERRSTAAPLPPHFLLSQAYNYSQALWSTLLWHQSLASPCLSLQRPTALRTWYNLTSQSMAPRTYRAMTLQPSMLPWPCYPMTASSTWYRRYDTAIDGASAMLPGTATLQSYGRPMTVLRLTVCLWHFAILRSPLAGLWPYRSATGLQKLPIVLSMDDRQTIWIFSRHYQNNRIAMDNGQTRKIVWGVNQIFIQQQTTDRLDEFFEVSIKFSYSNGWRTD